MNLKSKYFDMIRAERRRETVADHTPRCDWPACDAAAPHPAPAGPREAGRRHFCREHITQYNMSYDFFEGMSAEDVEQYPRATGEVLRAFEAEANAKVDEAISEGPEEVTRMINMLETQLRQGRETIEDEGVIGLPVGGTMYKLDQLNHPEWAGILNNLVERLIGDD